MVIRLLEQSPSHAVRVPPLHKGAFGAVQPGKTILDKSPASPVDCCSLSARRKRHHNFASHREAKCKSNPPFSACKFRRSYGLQFLQSPAFSSPKQEDKRKQYLLYRKAAPFSSQYQIILPLASKQRSYGPSR